MIMTDQKRPRFINAPLAFAGEMKAGTEYLTG